MSAAAQTTGNLAGYDPVLISLVRRAMPNLIAYDIAGVQPMSHSHRSYLCDEIYATTHKPEQRLSSKKHSLSSPVLVTHQPTLLLSQAKVSNQLTTAGAGLVLR